MPPETRCPVYRDGSPLRDGVPAEGLPQTRQDAIGIVGPVLARKPLHQRESHDRRGYAELDSLDRRPAPLPRVRYSGSDRAQIRGGAKWKDGYWTLELSRDLKTGSKYDHDFEPGKPLYMWLNVFDHTQTRHTRHPRPVRVVVQE